MSIDTSAVESILSSSVAGLTTSMILKAVIVAVFCLTTTKVILGFVDRMMARSSLDVTIKKLSRLGLKILLLFVTVIIVLGYLNIPVTSLVAVLSVGGLALSLAMQNFLANVAGGLQLIASKPFQINDFVEIGGCTGTVQEIGLFYTKLSSGDNKLIQLPNSVIVAQNIINYSSEEKRRVDIKVSASYEAPIEAVKDVLARLVGEHPLTLATPEPVIHVSAYKDSAIEYVVRAWCANGDYWKVYFDLMDTIKPAFDAAGIEMTYPHVNVHMAEK